MDSTPDTWYEKLSIEFEDGSTEVLHIERRPTGTHIPLLKEKAQPWTKLSFHKCSCCPLPDYIRRCPAAISLQTTMSKLRPRKSTEMVKGVAVDAQGRSQTVEWRLHSLGATLVQLAVFASDCPIGHRLKPCLLGLPPFVNSLDLARHIGSAILKKHGGSTGAAKKEIVEALTPLHDVFVQLTNRIHSDHQSEPNPAEKQWEPQDAVPNAIAQTDSVMQLLACRADKLLAELSTEIGWTAPGKPRPPQTGREGA